MNVDQDEQERQDEDEDEETPVRFAVYLLGTELMSVETGPESRHPDDDPDEDQDDAAAADAGSARAGRARRSDRAGAGTVLAAGELAPHIGFTRPWTHLDPDPEDTTHGSPP